MNRCDKCSLEWRSPPDTCPRCQQFSPARVEDNAVTVTEQDAHPAARHVSGKIIIPAAFLLIIFLMLLWHARHIGIGSSRIYGLRTNPKDSAVMVWVPGGKFTMGSLAGVGDPDEHPAHQVTLTGYWIYRYDVTVVEYRAFCAATGHALPPWPGNMFSWMGKSGWGDPALRQHPVVKVTWYDAVAYAQWAGVRLPTEAQWEYAARGPAGNDYPWGGKATVADPSNGRDDSKCANRRNSMFHGISTWPVGSFPANKSWCGAYDMSGNVWQWCTDWYGDYAKTPVMNPTGPATGTNRVLRGGGWYRDNSDNRSAKRNYNNPHNDANGSGFRCLMLATAPK